VILTLTLHTKAQVNVQAGYGMYNLKAPGFQIFFNTYNNYFAADIKTPFKDDFSPAFGFWWRAGYCFSNNDPGFYLNAITGVSKFNTKNTVTLSNDDQREVKLSVSDWSTDLILGFGSNTFHVAPVGSFYLRNNRAYNGFIYTDGTKSYGTEKILNGIFSASRFSTSFGAEVGFGIKQLNLICRATKINKPFEKDGSTYLDYYKDFVDFKDFNPVAAHNPTEYFPADVEFFQNDQLASESANNMVYINDRGWQISIGVQINLNFRND
jgi:hypothetical protein